MKNIKKSERIAKESKNCAKEAVSIKGELKKLSAAIIGHSSNTNKGTFCQVAKNTPQTKVPTIKKQVLLIFKPKNKHSQQQNREDKNKMVDPSQLKFSNLKIRQNVDISISTDSKADREKIMDQIESKML